MLKGLSHGRAHTTGTRVLQGDMVPGGGLGTMYPQSALFVGPMHPPRSLRSLNGGHFPVAAPEPAAPIHAGSLQRAKRCPRPFFF